MIPWNFVRLSAITFPKMRAGLAASFRFISGPGESELYGVFNGSPEVLDSVTLAGDVGIGLNTWVHVDSTAAKGMVERRGITGVLEQKVDNLLF